MDINGVYASVNYPSGVTGFGGTLFSEAKDPALGLACVQAWNDWIHEEWATPFPERFIPLGITFLTDPEKGAAEIRRNAKRGFKAVTIPEQPHNQGLPSVFQPHWEPIVRACAETGTVLSLHVGSSGFGKMPPGAPMLELGATKFGPMAIDTCAEWLWSGWPAKYPELKIAIAESGIGWVAMLARPPRQHHGALGLRRELERQELAVRGVTTELLVLHDRRSVHDLDARAHRHRSRGRGVGLSAWRWNVAGYSGGDGEDAAWVACGVDSQDHA